ncbi:uncharacterized protein SPSC_06123 [Sporisorium scitamineum]|uniref:Uncharacterized protein n=1 Tax=Sporisorium scitamineum TaxID=49012 RepID=A0A0F7S873_9BASI|nr:uncharacterized protein SPSC_06123 [Sporisorium scitamineum]CDW97110.1 hypothetical protein [Sporisorium scitamineum]
MADTSTSSAIALASDASQALLVLAPALLLSSVLRTPRIALYIKSEALVILTLVYAFRYSHLSLSLDNIAQWTHLLMLGLAAFSLHWFQTKACIPKPSTDSDNSDEEEKPLDPLPATLEPKRTSEFNRLAKFDPRLFVRLLFWSCLPALYSGPHSLLARAMDTYYHKPTDPFWQHAYVQLCIVVTLLETNALVLLCGRVLFQRRAQINLPPPTEAQLKTAKIDEDEWKERLHTPKSIWVFMWFTVASAALTLPGLVKEVGKAKAADMDLLMWRTVGNAMLVIMFGMMLLFYKSMRSNGIQLPKEDEDQDKAGDNA